MKHNLWKISQATFSVENSIFQKYVIFSNFVPLSVKRILSKMILLFWKSKILEFDKLEPISNMY